MCFSLLSHVKINFSYLNFCEIAWENFYRFLEKNPVPHNKPTYHCDITPLQLKLHYLMMLLNYTRFSLSRQMVFEKKILKKTNKFLIIPNHSLLKKGVGMHFNKLDLLMRCTKFGWNWPFGCEEEVENLKRLQTDRETDGHRAK